MGKVIYFGYFSSSTSEGGQARNNAFWRYFKALNCSKVFNLNSRNTFARKNNMLYFWIYLFFTKKQTVFIHQIGLVSLFYINNNKLKRICFKLCRLLLNRVSNRNNLIIEVNDLYYEQSIGLELFVDDGMLCFQNIIYTVNRAYYIFASNQMAKYASLKYHVKYFSVIINGCPILAPSDRFNIEVMNNLDSNKIHCVYAGSLNRGRQIEQLIQIFSLLKEIDLILLGDMGEWLETELLPENINYLGSCSELVAMQVVSDCDLGLIPYSSSIEYYNICYPTKASFYVGMGIPFLSTPLCELVNVFGDKPCLAIFADIDDWCNALLSMNKAELGIMKHRCLVDGSFYSWDKLIRGGLEKINII